MDIVGSGPLENKLRSLKFPDNLEIHFLGHLSYPQIAQAMENAGVLIFPTLADEWGMVVNEAFTCGLPVIGSRFGQASTTLIEDRCNGWLYTPTDQASLFRCLDELHTTSAQKLLDMRVAARATVADITATTVAAKAVSKFCQLLENSSKSHSSSSS